MIYIMLRTNLSSWVDYHQAKHIHHCKCADSVVWLSYLYLSIKCMGCSNVSQDHDKNKVHERDKIWISRVIQKIISSDRKLIYYMVNSQNNRETN